MTPPHASPGFRSSIALLIDADNSPSSKIDFIISELASHGVVNIRRAYGNWKKPALAGWEKVLHENSIQPMQSFDLVKGKNATDMSLAIDAMDILYTKNVTTFALVSSDCDFTPLIQRLRADGKEVFGFGGQKTPEPFIASCTRFLYLDEEAKPPKQAKKGAAQAPSEPPAPNSPNALKGNTRLMNTLRSAVKESADDDGWARLGPVGSRIRNAGPFDERTYGFKKLGDLFSAIDLFELKKEKNGDHTITSVRLKKQPRSARPVPSAGSDDKGDPA